MQREIRLTPTSYIVLGLIEALGVSTPYDLKKALAAGLYRFWTIPHAQLYTETQRLAKAGLLSERRETAGRRRRRYAITDAGREALQEWLAEPTRELTKGRISSYLKLVLGADPQRLAENQLPGHQEKLAEYEALQGELGADAGQTMRLFVDIAVELQQELVRYWERLAKTKRAEEPPKAPVISHEIRLTSNSYLIFSLLEAMGEATPYALKQAVADWGFWSLHQAQVYNEPKRLAEADYLTARQETGGRRRHFYEITDKGREALRQWILDPTAEADELRDLAFLKLFFGADPKPLAKAQLPAHQGQLAELEQMHETIGSDGPLGIRLVFEAGIRLERILVRFWARLAEGAT